ncbi:MAG: 3-deoxy-8-phosphooctulonate synthase [Kiritimatiellia bacterium]
MRHTVRAGNVELGGETPLALIAGPCVIPSREDCLELAEALTGLARRKGIPFVFKASYDKANRTSHQSYRGPGAAEGLAILKDVRETFHVPVLTDVHETADVEAAAAVADILQIPAFLCRQTDLVLAAAQTGKTVNIKKGQFLAPWDMKQVLLKAASTGNRQLCVTERGACFGYNNLVADMRSLLVMREFGYPVIFDATHSVQRPGGGTDHSVGDGQWAPALARAAVATGCDAVFLETYLSPEKALSDRENSIPFDRLESLWEELSRIDAIVE